MFRINHPTPFAIKYWEVGNELYGNGWYYGNCGWEADMHVPYPASGNLHRPHEQRGAVAGRVRHGREGVAAAMKAVDLEDQDRRHRRRALRHRYTNWNSMALQQAGGRRDGLRVAALVRGERR